LIAAPLARSLSLSRSLSRSIAAPLARPLPLPLSLSRLLHQAFGIGRAAPRPLREATCIRGSSTHPRTIVLNYAATDGDAAGAAASLLLLMLLPVLLSYGTDVCIYYTANACCAYILLLLLCYKSCCWLLQPLGTAIHRHGQGLPYALEDAAAPLPPHGNFSPALERAFAATVNSSRRRTDSRAP
jgi:hypothetical protein